MLRTTSLCSEVTPRCSELAPNHLRLLRCAPSLLRTTSVCSEPPPSILRGSEPPRHEVAPRHRPPRLLRGSSELVTSLGPRHELVTSLGVLWCGCQQVYSQELDISSFLMSSAADYELQLRRNGTATTRALSPPLLHARSQPGLFLRPDAFPRTRARPARGCYSSYFRLCVFESSLPRGCTGRGL